MKRSAAELGLCNNLWKHKSGPRQVESGCLPGREFSSQKSNKWSFKSVKYPRPEMFFKTSAFCLFTPQSCSDLPDMLMLTAGDLVDLPPRHLMQTRCYSGIKTIYNNWLLAF